MNKLPILEIVPNKDATGYITVDLIDELVPTKPQDNLLTPLFGRSINEWVAENPGVDFMKAWKRLRLEPPFVRLALGTVVRLRDGVKGPWVRTGVITEVDRGPYDQYYVTHDGENGQTFGWTRAELETYDEWYGGV